MIGSLILYRNFFPWLQKEENCLLEKVWYVHGRKRYFTLLLPIVTWRYYCSKAGIETVQEVADRLNRKERIEVFLSASNETKVLILSSVLHSDLVDSLMRIASHFEHGKVIP